MSETEKERERETERDRHKILGKIVLIKIKIIFFIISLITC